MDDLLICKIRQGDTKAFESIYHAYYDRLCRFATQLLHSATLAEEVVDDVLFYLWDHHESIDITSIQAYLFKAVRNRCLNQLKSNRFYFENPSSHADVMDRIEFISSLFTDANPLEQLLYQEMEEKVKNAIEHLPDECRHVFIKCRIERKKYSEVAAELGISINTVKYHLKNAIRILSQTISLVILMHIIDR